MATKNTIANSDTDAQKPKRRLSPQGGKAKGSNFEREVAAHMTSYLGIEVRRALLSGGGRNDGGADLENTPHVHMELKRTEKFAPKTAMRQALTAVQKARNGARPVVVNRGSHTPTGESLVVMRLDDWLGLYKLALDVTRNGAVPLPSPLPVPGSVPP